MSPRKTGEFLLAALLISGIFNKLPGTLQESVVAYEVFMEQPSTQSQGVLQNSVYAAGSTILSASESFNLACGTSIPPLNHGRDITCDWLTTALRVMDSTVPAVSGFKMSSFTETDHDCTVRLDLSYVISCKDTKPGPANVLCKMSRSAPAPQWGEPIEDVCHRETAAYLELKYHDVCRMPKLLFSVMDKNRYTFLLQDESGALPVDHHTSSVGARIDAVLRELALLHGSFARYSPVSAPSWLLKPRDSAELIGERYSDGMRCLLASDNGSLLSADHWQVITAFADKIIAWHKFDRHILTITHGDMRVENLLYQGQGPECRATLVGWKLAGLRNPMWDIASLLSNSLTVKDRRDNEKSWLERYRRQFEQSGTFYAGGDARDDYRFHLFAPLIFNVSGAAILGRSTDRNNFLIDNIARNCQAIIDWNALKFVAMQIGTV